MASETDRDDQTVDLWTQFNSQRGTSRRFKTLVDEERQQGRRVKPAPSLSELEEEPEE